VTTTITRWVCHRCKTDVWRGALKDTEESPPGWAVLVIADPPLADPRTFKRTVVCDNCKLELRNTWLNQA
jgi:hypothetical protein